MKFFTFLTITIFSFIFLTASVYAQSLSLTDIEELNVDTSIRSEAQTFTTPDSVLIAPLFAPNNLNVTAEQRYRGIFHYTIDRLGYNDVPFHYVVTPDGEIFEGNTGGDETRIFIDGYDGNPVVVAYITDQFSTQFDPRALDSINQLVLEIANTNSIDAAGIDVEELQFVRDRDSREVSIVTEQVFGAWNSQRDEIALFVDNNFSPVSKPYSAEVIEVVTPSEPVEPGSIVEASITLRNTSDYGFYALSNSEIYLTKADETTSRFFVNNQWVGQFQAALFDNEDTLAPGEEATYTFPLYVPLFLGTQTETFTIKNALGAQVDVASFDISLDVQASDRQIVEVRDRGFDFYPVYDGPNSSSAEVFRAVSGQRFFFLQDLGNGWYEIDLGNDQTGWIAFWNVSFV